MSQPRNSGATKYQQTVVYDFTYFGNEKLAFRSTTNFEIYNLARMPLLSKTLR